MKHESDHSLNEELSKLQYGVTEKKNMDGGNKNIEKKINRPSARSQPNTWNVM